MSLLQCEDAGRLAEITSLWRRSGQSIALVPTMGNLHEGHLSLVHAARAAADRVLCSIYVNPTQFGAGEDFEQYPRTLEDDCRQLEAAGCDLAFVPGDEVMYPHGLEGAVRLTAAPGLADRLEGRSRPGHFDGVVTVVARLFNLCRPDIAVFGEKDYQQLLVIRHMTRDLGYPISILPVATMREAGGLAMSSRNGYLTPERRKEAAALFEVLGRTAEKVAAEPAEIETAERAAVVQLEAAGFRVDYVAVRRADDLAPPRPEDIDLRVLAAAWSGDTRLIDNMAVLAV